MKQGPNHLRGRRRALLLTIVLGLLLVPVAAIAAGGFNDVAEDNQFVGDIQWMKDARIVNGCNPPANTEYCPEDNVTREQLAAFLHRVAKNRVVDAGTVEGLTAAELKGQQGDTGPEGPTGPDGVQGPQGEPGVLGFYTRTASGSWATEEELEGLFYAIALCDPGDLVTGGGYDTGLFEEGGPMWIAGSSPNADDLGPGWTVYGFPFEFEVDPADLTAYAVCADITP